MMNTFSLLRIASDRRGPYFGKAEAEKRSKKLKGIVDTMSNLEIAQKSQPEQESERISESMEPEPEQDSELIIEPVDRQGPVFSKGERRPELDTVSKPEPAHNAHLGSQSLASPRQFRSQPAVHVHLTVT